MFNRFSIDFEWMFNRFASDLKGLWLFQQKKAIEIQQWWAVKPDISEMYCIKCVYGDMYCTYGPLQNGFQTPGPKGQFFWTRRG